MQPSGAFDHAAEREWVRRAQAGEADAQRELIVRHQQRLYAYLWRMVRDHHEAEELCQETFVRAIEHLHSFSPQYRFSTWLFTIGYRVALNQRRKKRALATDDEQLGAIDPGHDRPDDVLASSELARRVKDQLWAAVDQLSLPQKTAVHLFYRENFSCEQVAEVLECPVDTVKSHLHRARARLREALEPTLAEAAGA